MHKLTAPALQRHKATLLARLQPAPDLLRASYVKQYLTCGKPNCRCHRDSSTAHFLSGAVSGHGQGQKIPAQTPRNESRPAPALRHT